MLIWSGLREAGFPHIHPINLHIQLIFKYISTYPSSHPPSKIRFVPIFTMRRQPFLWTKGSRRKELPYPPSPPSWTLGENSLVIQVGLAESLPGWGSPQGGSGKCLARTMRKRHRRNPPPWLVVLPKSQERWGSFQGFRKLHAGPRSSLSCLKGLAMA